MPKWFEDAFWTWLAWLGATLVLLAVSAGWTVTQRFMQDVADNQAARIEAGLDKPASRYPPPKEAAMPTPTCAGYFWAKWIDCAPEMEAFLYEGGEWGVVLVWENASDPSHPEHLRVSVPGVVHSQALASFEWGPGPLSPPSR